MFSRLWLALVGTSRRWPLRIQPRTRKPVYAVNNDGIPLTGILEQLLQLGAFDVFAGGPYP